MFYESACSRLGKSTCSLTATIFCPGDLCKILFHPCQLTEDRMFFGVDIIKA